MHSVLVIEHDDTLRTVIRGWVDALGFRAREAPDADTALVLQEREPAAIALCDLRMPVHNGAWVASRIRERFPDTAIIITTAARDVETAVASLRNDVVDYLLKPFDRNRLEEALTLARDCHAAAAGLQELQFALQDRLRKRRATVAARLSEAQESEQEALEGLIAILQLHERDGRGHAVRVARMAIALADELGLEENALLDVETGALLHDIGKLDIPSSILAKPAPLDEREWQIMRTHPRLGYDLLSPQRRFSGAATLVLSHHEAYDGSGYPRKLRGDEIPMGARVLAVADAYDSMTQPHVQRPPMPPAMALDEIERCSGRQFDPLCVEALGSIIVHAAEEVVA
jgi:putative nucleotidyltransferase with HDIG domain